MSESSVLVKGMKMPQKCGQCKLFYAEHPMHCMAVEGHRTVGAPYGMSRPDWCPLIEVKEKGDGMSKYKLDVCETIIKTHEVIIETDEDIGDICDEIERLHMSGIWDIQYIDGVDVVKIVEDADGMSEFEVEGVERDSVDDEVIE